MSPFARLRVVRLFLASGAAMRALGWGIVAGLSVLLAAAAVGSVLSEARPPKKPATPPTTSPPAPAAPTPRRKSLRVTPGWLRVTLG